MNRYIQIIRDPPMLCFQVYSLIRGFGSLWDIQAWPKRPRYLRGIILGPYELEQGSFKGLQPGCLLGPPTFWPGCLGVSSYTSTWIPGLWSTIL